MQLQNLHTHLKDKETKDGAKTYDAGMTMLRQSHADARRLINGVRPAILDRGRDCGGDFLFGR